MTRFALHFAATLIVMLALDALWLGLVAAKEYRAALGEVMLESFRPVPAVLFYLIYVASLCVLAEGVLPGGLLGAPRGLGVIAGTAAVFGFAAYATYDMTNLATLRPWTTKLAVEDLCWGTFLSTVSATVGTIAARAAMRGFGW